MANTEGAQLLPSTAPSPDASRGSRRPQALRIVLGIVSALAFVAGSVVAVDLLSQHQQSTLTTTSLSATTTTPESMEAQFGWSTWCSVRAAAGCMFSSDRDKCKEEVKAKCDPSEEAEDNSGGDNADGDGDGSRSGSGSGMGMSRGSGSGSSAGSHHGMPNVGEPEVRRGNNTDAPPKKRRSGRRHRKSKHVPQRANV